MREEQFANALAGLINLYILCGGSLCNLNRIISSALVWSNYNDLHDLEAAMQHIAEHMLEIEEVHKARISSEAPVIDRNKLN